jgi:hypothetical protein
MRIHPVFAIPSSLCCLAGAHAQIQNQLQFEQSQTFKDLKLSEQHSTDKTAEFEIVYYKPPKNHTFGKYNFSVSLYLNKLPNASSYSIDSISLLFPKQGPEALNAISKERATVFTSFIQLLDLDQESSKRILSNIVNADVSTKSMFELFTDSKQFAVTVHANAERTNIRLSAP